VRQARAKVPGEGIRGVARLGLGDGEASGTGRLASPAPGSPLPMTPGATPSMAIVAEPPRPQAWQERAGRIHWAGERDVRAGIPEPHIAWLRPKTLIAIPRWG